MTSPRPRRSTLYMPGSKSRALEKGKELATDAIIFDLEDAVAPDMKEEARNLVNAAVSEGGYGKRELTIRVNGLDTPWFEDDLAAAAAAKPDAILIPKVSTADDVEAARTALTANDADPSIDLWAMMETPLAMLNAKEIAATAKTGTHTLTAFVMGTNDLSKDTGAAIKPGREALLTWLSICVAAGHAYGVNIIDGVYNDYQDESGFIKECEQGKDLGMHGKSLIHPSQLAPCNKVFSPSEHELTAAKSIIEAFALPENQGKGAITVNGKMVELLHLEIAKRKVAIADAISASEG